MFIQNKYNAGISDCKSEFDSGLGRIKHFYFRWIKTQLNVYSSTQHAVYKKVESEEPRLNVDSFCTIHELYNEAIRG